MDAFQGREADVVVFSCVRAAKRGGGGDRGGRSGGVGFLADVRRMNVGLTRARKSLWVVGHAATLCGSGPWRALLQHAEREHSLVQACAPYGNLFSGGAAPLATLPARR